MHLLNEDFSVLCLSLTALGVVAFLAPLASLVAVRIVAGRNR